MLQLLPISTFGDIAAIGRVAWIYCRRCGRDLAGREAAGHPAYLAEMATASAGIVGRVHPPREQLANRSTALSQN